MKIFPTFHNQPTKAFPAFYKLKTHHCVHKKRVLFEPHISEAMIPYFFNIFLLAMLEDRGSTVVKVLCYKSEGHRFDSKWFHWNFSLT